MCEVLRRALALFHFFKENGETLLRESDSDKFFGFENGPLDQCWSIDHCRKRMVTRHVGTIDFGYLAPGQAFLVQKFFPAYAIGPAFKHLNIETVVANIMKAILNFFGCQESTRFPARVAAVDSVNRQHGVVALVRIAQQVIEACFCASLSINMFDDNGTVQGIFSVV